LTRKTFFLTAFFLTAPALFGASEAPSSDQVSGPVLGYLFDSQQGNFLPVWGIPGAARIGDPLLADVSVVTAEVSPSQAFALGIGAGGEVYKISLSPAGAAGAAIDGLTGIDRVVISPSGSAAAAYDRQTGSAALLTNLGGDPTVGGTADLSSVPGVLTGLAVNDAGTVILAASASRDAGALSAVRPGDAASPIGAIGRAVGLAFVAGTNDAVVADVDRGEILSVRNVTGGGEIIVLASGSDGVEGAVAVGAANGSALAVSTSMGALITVPLGGGSVTITDCECQPTTVSAMNGVHRLTSDLTSAIILADVTGADPRILFVPALGGAAQTTSSSRSRRGR